MTRRAALSRRAFLDVCTASCVAALFWPARSESPVPFDVCLSPTNASLPLPGQSGWFARIAADVMPLTLEARRAPISSTMPWSLAYRCRTAQGIALNPTLVASRGARVRVELVNMLDAEPTIVHWHGLANATANDGAGFVLAQPAETYRYDFTIRNRAGLYWYHPHPHGLAAGQAYRGLFGLLEVTDDEEAALREALDLVPGVSEIALVLQDRRGAPYMPTALDRHRGFLGEHPHVNGVSEPFLDVATRIYRLRILNASNARTYRLGLRDGAGRSLGFTLIGTDGGLLSQPVACEECLISPAERIDVLVDFRGRRRGETVTLETRTFDPMHFDPPAASAAAPSEAAGTMAHAGVGEPAADARSDHAGAWPEGAPHGLLAFRVRERIRYSSTLPRRLSTLPPVEVEGVEERAFRLGFNKGRWRINDRVFSMGETPIEVRHGTREIWLVRNYHTSMPHAMHLHGVQFQVLERETSPEFLVPLAVHDRGRLATDLGWKDTVLVWPGESVRLAIDFALPYDPPQTYLFHCHNLEHEDGGMMLGVAVR